MTGLRDYAQWQVWEITLFLFDAIMHFFDVYPLEITFHNSLIWAVVEPNLGL